jgi:pimeloyl-ACP methyl ester carboxylesterase
MLDAEPRRHYETFASHDGVSIAFRTSGEGPPVVLVHGYTVTSTVNFATHYSESETGRVVPGAGPTVETALVDAGHRVVLYDLRGHGHSGKPHDVDSYSFDAHVGDLRDVIDQLGLEAPALVGYSLGAMIAAHVLCETTFSRVALCGVGSLHIAGEPGSERLDEMSTVVADCFLNDAWQEHPEAKPYRAFARLGESPDFLALGAAGRALRSVPKELVEDPKVPVLVLNGGRDLGADEQYDLARLIPGALGVVAGGGDHGSAPSDPAFQQALVSFLR